MRKKSLSGKTKVIVDGNGVHQVDDSTKNKIILISIVVMIFIFSIGLIAWVVIKENYYREEEVRVQRFSSQVEEEFVAQNEKQKTLLLVKDEIDTIESDIEAFYSLLNDKNADEFGELLIDNPVSFSE